MVQVSLKASDRIHFIGIAGTAMAGVAGLLKQKGFDVRGSDQNVYPPMSEQLKKKHISWDTGYDSARLKGSSLVIVGNSISADNLEAQALLQSDIPYLSLPEVIRAFLIEDKQSLVVSGTHGKTTTSSLLAWLVEYCHGESSFLIGGIPNNFNQSFKHSKSPWFVVEGDEYDTAFFDKRPKFIHYQPFSVILTRIEFDHADIYENLEKVKNSFGLLTASLPQDGHLVVNAEDKNILDVVKNFSKKVIFYGITKGDYRLEDRKVYSSCQEFCVVTPSGKKLQVTLPLFGLHNAMNALSVLALACELGWDSDRMIEGMAQFQGVRRRFQILAETPKVALVEDFAHHPTAVSAVLSALREKYPKRDLIAVFEPRSASSRRNVFQKQYAEAFSKADKVFAAAPYREFEIKKEERFSSLELEQDLKARGVVCQFHKDVQSMAQAVVQNMTQPSVIVVMSNGPFGGIHQKIQDLL